MARQFFTAQQISIPNSIARVITSAALPAVATGDAMKRIFCGAIALIAMGAKAGAADLPLKAPAPYAPYDWTGFYVGAHAGWESADVAGFTNNNSVGPGFRFNPDDSPVHQSMRGWLGGGQLGYNHQIGRAVVGLEFSGSWSNLSSHDTGTIPNVLDTAGNPVSLGCSQQVNISTFTTVPNATTSISCSAKEDWTIQAVTRLGYAFGDGHFLPYVEAGVAFTHLSIATSINTISPGPNSADVFGNSSELMGAVLGGGVQYALGNGFSLGVEYLYARYPTQDFSSIGTFTETAPLAQGSSFTHPIQENRDLTTNSVRAVLNYKFPN